MDIRTYRILLESSGYGAQDINAYIAELIYKNNLRKGLAVVYTNEKGCSVVEIEYEPELLADLEEFLKNIGCMDSGLCSILLGKSVVVPIINNSLFLGQFKKIVFIDISRVSGEKSLVIVLEGLFKDS